MEGQQPRWGEIFSFDAGITGSATGQETQTKKHLPEAKRQHKETVARSVTAQLSSRSREGSVYCCWRPSGRAGWRGIGGLTAGDFGGELEKSVDVGCRQRGGKD